MATPQQSKQNINNVWSTPIGTPINIPKTNTVASPITPNYNVPNVGLPGTTTSASTSATLGLGAKAPEQNIKPQSTTLPANQVKTTIQKPVTTLPNQASTAKPTNVSTTKMATLYGPNGQKKAVAVGSPEASQLQSQGWGLTVGSYKAPASPTSSTVTSSAKTDTTPPPPDISSKGLLQGLVTTSQAGSPIAKTSEENLMNLSSVNAATSGPALTAYNKAVQDLNNLDQEYARKKAELSSAPLSLSFKQGRQQVIDQEYSAQRAALASAVQTQQQAINQQIAGVGQQIAGYGQAAGLAQTGQGLVQSGLSTAANLAQPIQLPYGTPLVSPQTGTQIGSTAGGVQPNDPFYQTMQTYANLLATNQGSAVPATITGNPVLNAQLIQMAKQINPNYNVNVATGAAGAQASTAGTQFGQIQGYQSALQQGQNLQNQLIDLLNQFGLNPSDINKVNQGLQTIAQNTSDPRYAILQNYINDIANTYAQILTPSGGSQTDQTRSIASSMLDSSMKGTGIQDVMKSLDEAAKAKIAGISTTGGLGGSTGSTVSAGGFNFVKDANGNWVVAR